MKRNKVKFVKKISFRGIYKDGIPRYTLDIPRIFIRTKEVQRNDIFRVALEYVGKEKDNKTS